jgi:hypothetical protein
MSKRRRILLWLGLVLSVPAGGYAGLCVGFYAWLSAAEPERWPSARAAVWAYSSLGFAVLFLALFIYCLVALIREANRQYRQEQNAT